MQDNKIPVTPQGYVKMKEDLRVLKAVERPAIVKEIEEARAQGDLSENAEYQYAKEKQGLIEARIRDLEAKFSMANVVDVTKLKGSKVVFGATVTLMDLDTDEEITYRIVGDYESDIENNLIAFSAPLARGLIGKEVGDEVKIKTPGGMREVEILKVEYI